MSMTVEKSGSGQGLSSAVRAASAAAHTDAEQAPFLAALTGGRLPIEGYARLVAQHHAIYTALEAPTEAMRDDADAGPFVDDDVLRVPALAADLEALLGAGWPSLPVAALLPVTEEYCARIEEVAATWPAGWVAHHYVRYLGDLSGGLYLRRAIESVYGVDATSGTAFYDFPGVPDPTAWKDAYRRRLDEAPWARSHADEFTAEVLTAYRLNTVLFEQLGG